LDFYHQHIWKFSNQKKPRPETHWGCTRCGQLLETYEEVTEHCDIQDCENQETIDWLEALQV